ncbi:MarR family transcriptional regulator [Nocardioides marmoriginsengisoli]|uniref:MarR family transcriptional regulator n=1 Tax=Nocardioides marmoriginsengisoli TaxID=661483 RepID=A0A3N0CGW4_9ACTN|nr:MarR family transcriptional regulator [Nocardioides marmoriginsengisoli]RNL62471.1 MarR family transcriptional regulator [Nocardioides marmoriginsengisoli]
MSNREQLHAEYASVMRDFMATAVFFQDAVARAAGLNSTDLQALGVLLAQGSATPGELAQHTGITAGGAITLLVDRLEKAGFVRRSRDAQDRRKVRITADLEQVGARLAPLYAGVSEAWNAFLATQTTDQLRIGIAQLQAAVEVNREQTERLPGGPGRG